MAGRINLTVRRSFRTVKNDIVMKQREIVLFTAAHKIQDKARELARVPKGLGTGRKTGELEARILVEGPTRSESGKSMYVKVYASAPHAVWQEYGTGIHGTGPQATHSEIYPKQGQVMTWTQSGRPYRGRYVMAQVTGFRMGRSKSGKLKRVPTQWQQFASEVKGVQPKHFMRDARNDKTIKKWYQDEMANITKNNPPIKVE